MKRYEKMNKEELVNFLGDGCGDTCRCWEYCVMHNQVVSCRKTKVDWLNEEIETKPRWETIQSNDDWEDIYVEWLHKPSVGVRNFIDWLKEEVEV